MKTQSVSQLTFNFPPPTKIHRIVSERARDSVGQFATDIVEANDRIERISNERDIYRANYLSTAKQLIEIQREYNQLKNRVK